MNGKNGDTCRVEKVKTISNSNKNPKEIQSHQLFKQEMELRSNREGVCRDMDVCVFSSSCIPEDNVLPRFLINYRSVTNFITHTCIFSTSLPDVLIRPGVFVLSPSLGPLQFLPCAPPPPLFLPLSPFFLLLLLCFITSLFSFIFLLSAPPALSFPLSVRRGESGNLIHICNMKGNLLLN